MAIKIGMANDLIGQALDTLVSIMEAMIDTHTHTVRLARTHGQPAVPDSFGRRLEVLTAQVGRNAQEVHVVPGKIAGPVGSNRTAPVSKEIEYAVLDAFGLGCACGTPEHQPPCSQIVPRDFLGRWANDLTMVVNTIAAVGMEIRLLAQAAIGEVAEGRGPAYAGSSAMPHKRNPSQSERLTGLARMARAMNLALSEGIEQWNDRDLAHSSVERVFVPLLAGITEYAILSLTDILTDLQIDTVAMTNNLAAAGSRPESHDKMVALQLTGLSYTEAARAAQTKEEI
jgi:adenylosuccinate lyase